MNRTFLIMAGGTGGHVFPALATARKLQQKGGEVVWLGSKGGFEENVISDEGIPFFGLSISGLRGKGATTLLLAPIKLLMALYQASVVLVKVKPVCVLGMGGFASGPGGLAARLFRKPLVIHEQNAVAGMTNRLLSRLANAVFEAFPNSFGNDLATEVVGNPVREEIVRLTHDHHRVTPQTFAERKVRILIVGGSLGALKLNQVLPRALSNIEKDIRPEVRHQTGKGKLDATLSDYSALNVEADVCEFISDMAAAYRWADLVICRAGALTVSELCAAGVGAILVPYPFAVDDHQTKNAQVMVDGGAAWLAPQSELSEDALTEMLKPLLLKPERIARLANAAHKLAKPYAADRVAQACWSLSDV
ncbi:MULTISPECIES: undecaprenyldiphospho-muramoylpentapeptide beta-N-acetylglucosaminyltransferase [unclassified Oleiphilus]|uniref:undecaprenyldiphospho-muramoylpentapeptide beta-N-acetylglucosaminyltransferase n=1 Tax=unclassified Oleiphilus TaxID=2631174 RepID=UPI000AEF60F9|nr:MULTISPECIES: undecaprenyldiphospho-muramoylpentapeptide beta-N-acetylglucosaminyltransferase [unclassified Oleiphilus]